MANTRRPVDSRSAAEAVFQPAKKPVVDVTRPSAVPQGREQVTLRIDRAVLEHFQDAGPGWQGRINDALVALVGRAGAAEGKRPDELNATNDD